MGGRHGHFLESLVWPWGTWLWVCVLSFHALQGFRQGVEPYTPSPHIL